MNVSADSGRALPRTRTNAQALARAIHHDPVAGADIVLQQRERELVLDLLLDQAPERSGAQGRVPASLGQEAPGVVGQLP